ncbi:MAG: Gfo/Idh/MocA family oxidoreductase [Chloroflexi bacterium]|nr:Gfo/Idh/MocA family oxidoreductase [Chloroflexota bacterium]
MSGQLKGLVLGSGFAGQGHAEAMRWCGVEVVGMVSRTEEVVQRVAGEMGIPYASTEWIGALDALEPDIVAIGTPGGAHHEQILAAIERGCHVYCDKPLTTSAATSKELYVAARDKGVKTAFAASFRYQPHALLAKKLIAEGVIGEPWETECISHYELHPHIPWGWSHRIDLGGGRLSNNFTHKLSIVLHALEGSLIDINGEARNDMHIAPVVSGVHDFRERADFIPGPEVLNDVGWRDVDSEWSYSVMAHVSPARSARQPVTSVFRHGGMQPRFGDDYVAFYGDEASIYIAGAYAQGPLHVKTPDSDWERVELPSSIKVTLPEIEDDTQRNWTQLMQEFVADVRGDGYCVYQTFEDGWIFQEAVDAVRRGDGWFVVPGDA